MDWEDIRDFEELAAYDRMIAERSAANHNQQVQENVAVSDAVADGKERAKAKYNAPRM